MEFPNLIGQGAWSWDMHQAMVHFMAEEQTSTDEADRGNRANGGWVFPVFLAVLLVIAALIAQKSGQNNSLENPRSTQEKWTPSPPAQGDSVRLEIDFGNGATQNFAALPWQSEMTIADLMKSAQEFRPGITYVQKGEGEMGFLSTLQGLSNEGVGGRNWKYQVDGKHGQKSFCLQELSPGQHVLWKYDSEE